ncbi:hypothetical protein NLI96_g4685 [Meripilus lineatus]|uniref:Uncharacterized protein n=1 Tax=Meripilus lineatus TaxID=2056292 RepID=A0AAD5V985_9APHY|nr:hypothetical protein NLI96_g4685 [Physisporinus lineatus]
MSAGPAFAMGTLCIVGGITGYARTKSTISLVAGVSVGLLYLWSATVIQKGTGPGIQGALGASAVLFLSSAPRAAKGPVPAVLTAASALSGVYYGKAYAAL